ncbi:MAG TPA: flagellar motor switch protein FliN [Terriglobales bacterium]|nr:flagellar motor switch protein FliN [Terriglobales bacterium]
MSERLVQFVETWQSSIAQVMTQIAGKPVSVSWEVAAADATPARGEDDLWVRFRAPSFGNSSELAFHIRSADALTLAQVFMGEAIIPSAKLNEDYREAVAEASRQIAGRAATEFKQSFPDCEITYLAEPIPEWKPEASAIFRLTAADWAFTADVFLNASLSHYLSKPAETVPEPQHVEPAPVEPAPVDSGELVPEDPMSPRSGIPESQAAAKPVQAPAPPPVDGNLARPPVPRAKRNNLDLLLDVSLAVTLRFGERQLTLRDILQLRSGSVIELDRETDEPVDLLVDDRVIARGEVVVVNGNYGLRIAEICAHAERVGLLAQ